MKYTCLYLVVFVVLTLFVVTVGNDVEQNDALLQEATKKAKKVRIEKAAFLKSLTQYFNEKSSGYSISFHYLEFMYNDNDSINNVVIEHETIFPKKKLQKHFFIFYNTNGRINIVTHGTYIPPYVGADDVLGRMGHIEFKHLQFYDNHFQNEIANKILKLLFFLFTSKESVHNYIYQQPKDGENPIVLKGYKDEKELPERVMNLFREISKREKRERFAKIALSEKPISGEDYSFWEQYYDFIRGPREDFKILHPEYYINKFLYEFDYRIHGKEYEKRQSQMLKLKKKKEALAFRLEIAQWAHFICVALGIAMTLSFLTSYYKKVFKKYKSRLALLEQQRNNEIRLENERKKKEEDAKQKRADRAEELILDFKKHNFPLPAFPEHPSDEDIKEAENLFSEKYRNKCLEEEEGRKRKRIAELQATLPKTFEDIRALIDHNEARGKYLFDTRNKVCELERIFQKGNLKSLLYVEEQLELIHNQLNSKHKKRKRKR